MIHQLKTTPPYFTDVTSGDKTFEVRRNDRNYKVGDFLELNEYTDGAETGRCCIVRVCYILDTPEYCKDGYVILGIEPCAIVTREDRDVLYVGRPRDVPTYGRVEVQP